MESPTNQNEAIERRLVWIGAILLAAGALLCWILFGVRAAGSFAAGGILCGVNLAWLHRTVRSLVFLDQKASKRRILMGFFLRLLLIPLSFYVMLRFLSVSVPAAVAGFAVFNCSVFVEGVLETFKINPK